MITSEGGFCQTKQLTRTNGIQIAIPFVGNTSLVLMNHSSIEEYQPSVAELPRLDVPTFCGRSRKSVPCFVRRVIDVESFEVATSSNVDVGVQMGGRGTGAEKQ
jgi:hypothetical protein